MFDPDKYRYDEIDETRSPYADMQVIEQGNYLCVQWSDHPVHVYKRVQPGERVHPFTERIEHNGRDYRLELIDDEKEHATAR
jgi:hypothetical protein